MIGYYLALSHRREAGRWRDRCGVQSQNGIYGVFFEMEIKRLVRLIVAGAQEIACLTRVLHSARMRSARLGASDADFSQTVRNQCAQI